MQLRSIVSIGWLLFFAYWWISAIGVKRNIRGRSWSREIGVRLVLVVAIIAIVRRPGSRAFFTSGTPVLIDSVQGVAGLVLCVAGFALAVWARRHLGRNWGMPMTLKEGHELVTSGPYCYVRHPIYTGMLLAFVGSALVAGPFWLLICAAMGMYCLYSARTEERLMLQQFPRQYAEYRKHTKAIIPFVL